VQNKRRYESKGDRALGDMKGGGTGVFASADGGVSYSSSYKRDSGGKNKISCSNKNKQGNGGRGTSYRVGVLQPQNHTPHRSINTEARRGLREGVLLKMWGGESMKDTKQWGVRTFVIGGYLAEDKGVRQLAG